MTSDIKAMFEGQASLVGEVRREIAEFRQETNDKLSLLWVAVKQNSEDIRQNSEDIRELRTALGDVRHVVDKHDEKLQ